MISPDHRSPLPDLSSSFFFIYYWFASVNFFGLTGCLVTHLFLRFNLLRGISQLTPPPWTLLLLMNLIKLLPEKGCLLIHITIIKVYSTPSLIFFFIFKFFFPAFIRRLHLVHLPILKHLHLLPLYPMTRRREAPLCLTIHGTFMRKFICFLRIGAVINSLPLVN